MSEPAHEIVPLRSALRWLAADWLFRLSLAAYAVAFVVLGLSPTFEGSAETARNLVDPLLLCLTLFALFHGRSRTAVLERRFWDLLAVAWTCWLLVDLIYFFEFQTPWVSASFTTDALQFSYYLVFALAVDIRPHLSRKPSLTALGRRLESIAGLAAVFGLLIYFALVVLPDPLGVSLSFVPRAGGFTPLLLVRLSLAVLILSRLVFALLSSTGRWRALYALLAVGMLGYALRDLMSLLRYEELISSGPGFGAQAVLYIPGLIILVAARSRLAPTVAVEAFQARESTFEPAVAGRASLIGLYALVVPGFHFLLYPLGVLDLVSRTPREVFCLVYVFVLGGIAWIHQNVMAEDYRHAQAALVAAKERLASSRKLESVGRLAGGIAHDFNNYLTVIKGYSELLREGLPGSKQLSDLEYIEDAADKATHLTRQLLAFGRRQVLRPEALEVNAVVRNTGKMLDSLLGEDVALEVDLDPEAGLAQADLGQTEQLLVNLAINGRDAMPKGGTLSITTRRLEILGDEAEGLEVEAGSYVSLTVDDTGIGMSEEVRKQAFEPFFTTKELGRGTGLGLSTVYGVVNQSGGAITVDSTLGKGTSFTVLLPSATGLAPEQPTRAPIEQRLEPNEARLLLVEDEDAVRQLASVALVQAGFEVRSASDGGDAVERFLDRCETFDLLITDVLMPTMDGVELATVFQARCPSLRVLFLSGYPADTLRARQKILPSSLRLLEKPFSPSRLIEVVQEVLDETSPISTADTEILD